MTAPNFGFYMQAFTLVGGNSRTTNSQITTGAGLGPNSIELPLGENMLRVTALGSPEATVQIIVVQASKNTVLNDWQKVGPNGFIVQAPNDVEGAYFVLRTNTPGASFGLTLFNTPPAT